MKMLKNLLGLVLVAFLIIPSVLADDSSGLNPYGSGSSGLNPYGSGSSGLNPYGIGTGGLNPYGTGSSGLNPYGTGSSGLNPYGGGSTFTPTGSPTNNPSPNPNPNPGPGSNGPIWGQLSTQTIPEDSSIGTMVYRGLKSLCFDNKGVNMQVTTVSTHFDLRFSNNDLVLNRLTANWNGQELVGLSCNGSPNSFVLNVSPVNDAPTFTTSPITTGSKNNQYSYDANAVDVENDAFTFALINGPAGMTINSASGLVLWRPSSSQGGSHNVQLRVTDSKGASSNQAYTISVGSGNSGSGGSSGSKNKHNLDIASLSVDKTEVTCGSNFNLRVNLANLGDYSESATIKVENANLGISESKSTTIAKGKAESVNFDLKIGKDVTEGSYSLTAKLNYGSGTDSASKVITVSCDKKVENEKVITTSEPEKKKNILMIITLILAIVAGLGLLGWFVVLLRDEFYSTEKFI